MGTPDRIVRRLRLRADCESEVQHTVPALEDAFRTATLPDRGARLILVRRMSLGRLPRGATAQSLSRLIESRFTEADWTLVHGADGVPEDAQTAVWFRDALEAHQVAALRIAAGRPVDAWFWPMAIPALAGGHAAADALRAIAFSLATRQEAPSALPAWTASVVRAGHRDALIGALRPGDGARLLRAVGVRCRPARRGMDPPDWHERGDPPHPEAAHARFGVSRAPSPSFAMRDDRVQFVEQMLIGALWRPPAESASPSSSPAGRFAPRSTDVRHDRRHREERSNERLVRRRHISSQTTDRLDTGPSTSDSTTGTSASPIRTPLEDPQVARTGGSAKPAQAGRDSPGRQGHSQPITATGQADPHVATGVDRPTASAGASLPALSKAPGVWEFAGDVPTAAGGLLFLVPVLERLGFREWSADLDPRLAAPDVLAGWIFHLLLSRLSVAEDDPSWMFARLRASRYGEAGWRSESNAGRSLPAKAGSHTNPGGVASAFRRKIDPKTPEIWLSGCRRLLRRRARIGLASLVIRPARMALTPTHVDVFFTLTAADVRVRRAGLDLDPGWVPWLRRVVTFHYSDQILRSAQR